MTIVFQESAVGDAQAKAAENDRLAEEARAAGDHRGAALHRRMAEAYRKAVEIHRAAGTGLREESSGPPHSPEYIKAEAAKARAAHIEKHLKIHEGDPDGGSLPHTADRAAHHTAHKLHAENEGRGSPADPGYSGSEEYKRGSEEFKRRADEATNAQAERERAARMAAKYGKNEAAALAAAEFHLGDTSGMAIIFESVAAPAVTEASLAGIQATAGAPGGPGPGNDSAPEIPDAGLRGGLPNPPQQPAFPQTIRPDVLRRAKLRAAAASQFGGATMVLGNMGAMAEQVGDGVYDLHYDNGRMSAIVRSVGYMDLDESAPPSDEAEEWIMSNKKEFKRRYGANWRSYLYGKAWKLFGKDKGVKKEAGDAALEIYAGADGALVFSAIGETAAARNALLLEVSKAVAEGRGLSVLSEGAILEVATEAKAKEKAKPKSAWKMRRSLTDEEKAKLKVPHGEIRASVSHVPGHGYVVHTHRARSNFYKTPGAIPASSIHYISSTG